MSYFYLIKSCPKNIKVILTSNYIIFYTLFGMFFYKMDYKNLIYLNNCLYCFNLYKSNYFTFKKMIYSSLFKNNYGFSILMKLSGVGFKLLFENNLLIFRLGYCNILKIKIPFNIYIKCLSKSEFILFSLDFNCLYSFCTKIRSLKKAGIYKNYGIYYLNEIVILKKIKAKKENL